MAKATANLLRQFIHRVVVDPDVQSCSDQELLGRFHDRRDEASFEILVHRHGTMVLDVCRGLLTNEDDVEDAFQATFLILARKAHTLRKPAALASWLHGVACRTAWKARTEHARRQKHESRAPARSLAQDVDDLTWREVKRVLHEELNEMSLRHRTALVLCYLEGKTQEKAAAELGLPQGTLKGRLERARALLRARLVRRGLGPAGLLLFSSWPAAKAAAAPTWLVGATVNAAVGTAKQGATLFISAKVAALTQGVTRTMFFSRIKVVFALTLISFAVVVGSALAYWTLAESPPEASNRVAKAAVGAPDGAGKQPATADRYGDSLPPGALFRLGTTRFRHDDHINHVAFAPDGKTVGSVSEDGTVRLWDPATGKERRRFSLEGDRRVSFTSVAFSGDGQIVLTAGLDGVIRHWDVESGKQLHGCQVSQQNALFTTAAFSPNRRILASVGPAEDGSGVLGRSKTVGLWDTSTGDEVGRLQGHTTVVRAVAFGPDGQTIATGGDDKTVRLWDAATGKELRVLSGHEKPVYSLAFAPDGKTLASSGRDRTVRVWDSGTGRELRQFKTPSGLQMALAFSPDGSKLALAALGIHVWDLKTGKRLYKRSDPAFESGASSLTFSPDSKALATWQGNGSAFNFRIMDVATGKEALRFDGHDLRIADLTYSPDGKALASCSNERVLLWDPTTGKPLTSPNGPRTGGSSLCFFSGGKDLAVSASSTAVALWDAETWKVRGRLETSTQGRGRWSTVLTAAMPNGKTLVTADQGGGVNVWDTSKKTKLSHIQAYPPPTLRNRQAGLAGAALSPDGKILATTGFGGEAVRFWELKSGRELRRFEEHKGWVRSVAFSPDGRSLACGGASLWLVNPATGKQLHHLKLPGRHDVYALAFAPNSRVLASGYRDGTIRLWDLTSRKELRRLVTGQGQITRLAFSPDGRQLASGGTDTTVLVWDVAKDVRPKPAADPKPTPPGRTVKVRKARTPEERYAALVQKYDAETAAYFEAYREALGDPDRFQTLRHKRPDVVGYANSLLEIARKNREYPVSLDALLQIATLDHLSSPELEKVRKRAVGLLVNEYIKLGKASKRRLNSLCRQLETLQLPSAQGVLRAVLDHDPRRDVQAQAYLSLARHLSRKAEMVHCLKYGMKRSVAARRLREMEEYLGPVPAKHWKESDPDKLAALSAQCYKRLVESYKDVKHPEGNFAIVAQAELYALHHLAVGKTAPEIEGQDLDGKRLKLSDYRGKVVVLTFWATWCGPCMAMVPHEKKLVERLKGKPFVLLGVNADGDRGEVKKAIQEQRITWRSWWDGKEGPIATRWNVRSWPTVYVLDPRGVIRFKGVQGDDLDEAVESLLGEMRSTP